MDILLLLNSYLFMKTYLGVDWGEKRIGLAIGNSVTKMASPFKVVANLEKLLIVIEEEMIDKVILGNPIKMSGQKNDNPKYLTFLKKIKNKLEIPLILYDERLSTQAINSLIGCKKTKAPKDSVSAMIILDSYFIKYGRNL